LIPALYVILEDFSSLLGKDKETISSNDDTSLVQ
jgi:hypothetical protein